MINTYITELVNYGIGKGLIDELDRICITNRLVELMEQDEYISPDTIPAERDLHLILEDMMDWAYAHGVMKSDTVAARDLFDTKIMGILTPPPSVVIGRFSSLMNESSQKATDWYYEFSRSTNYIRTDRIAKDLKWVAPTEYGDIDITINLSKPEKDRGTSPLREKLRALRIPSAFCAAKTKATQVRSLTRQDRTTG